MRTIDQLTDFEEIPRAHPASLMSISREHFRSLARSAEVISFDVFDTLLHRKVVLPRDIFTLVGEKIGSKDFCDTRFAAEANARRAARPATVEVSLEEIYSAFPSGFLADAEHAWKTELEFESEFIFANEAALSLVRELRAAGRRVVAITDTYLSGAQVDALLKAKGFDVDVVYASSDYRSRNLGKYNGAIYPLVCEREGIAPAQMLHTGDHPEADVANALHHGVVAVQAIHPTGYLTANSDHYAAVFRENDSHSSSLVAGTIARNKLSDRANLASSIESFGYDFGGPLVTGFVAHMLERCRELGISHLVLLARDGCVVGDVLDALAPDGITYRIMPASRRLAVFPSFADGGFAKIKSLFAGQKRLTKRQVLAVLRLEHLLDGVVDADIVMDVRSAIAQLEPRLTEQAQRERAALLSFLEPEMQLLKDGGKFAWVDVGWALSSPARLNELLGHDIPGFFIGSHGDANRSAGFEGYLFSRGKPHDLTKVAMRSVEIFELVFADTMASAAYLEETPAGLATVSYAKSPAETVRDGHIKACRSGVRRFAEDFRQAFALARPEDLRAYNRRIWQRLCADPPRALYERLSVIPHDHRAGTRMWQTIGDLWLPNWRYGKPDRKAFPTLRTYRVAFLRRYLKWHLPPFAWRTLRRVEPILRKYR